MPTLVLIFQQMVALEIIKQKLKKKQKDQFLRPAAI